MACQVDFGVTEDVDMADGSHLFKLLDDGDGNLTHEEQLGLKGFGMISRSSEGGIRPLVWKKPIMYPKSISIKVPYMAILVTYPIVRQSHRQSQIGTIVLWTLSLMYGLTSKLARAKHVSWDHCLMIVDVKQKQEGPGTTQCWPSWKNMVKRPICKILFQFALTLVVTLCNSPFPFRLFCAFYAFCQHTITHFRARK